MLNTHFFIALSLISLIPRTSLAESDNRPNIITVFIDDLGWSDLGCFGASEINTSNIDRLAKEGICFTNFYVNSPICSPSRVALTTGQYPQRWKIASYLDNRKVNKQRGMAQWLDPTAPVLARELQKAGYATGHFGKWHMGGQRDVDNAPPISEYGFDRSLTNFEGMGAKLLPLAMKPEWNKPRRIWGGAIRLGGPSVWMLRSHITQGFVESAISFVDEAQRKDQPFYINLWPDDVHTPLYPPINSWTDEPAGRYKKVLEAMDRQLGPLFNRIRDDNRLRVNTIIVFCSDNGPQHGLGSSSPLRGAKTWLYEGGVRSPLIVWAPGLMPSTAAGMINEHSVLSAIDINRSFYQIAKISLPKEIELDGENVTSTLLGKTIEGRKGPIFWRRPPDRPGFGFGLHEDNPDLAVRKGNWKFYVNYDLSGEQLYNLKADPSEEQNLIDKYPEIANNLLKMILDWNKELPQDSGAIDTLFSDSSE